jgi:hypothetical protein
MSITIYGASDDLIAVEGDIREEFNYDSSSGDVLAFSNGVLLRVSYTDDGVWRIAPMATNGQEVQIVQAVSADSDSYSDRATITGDIKWVGLLTQFATA